jgi:hypothetical protein
MAGRAAEITTDDLERFRIALDNEIARTSLRAVARRVRMSPSGLTKFLDGSNPYGHTVARLREWYYGEAGVHQTPPELIAAQLRRFVVTLPKPNGGVAKLLEAVDASYREAGMFEPEWVRIVRALVA